MSDSAKGALAIIYALYQETGETKYVVTDLLMERKIKLTTAALEELDYYGYIDYHKKVADWFVFFPERMKNA